jgi:hypothetical protein
MMKRSLILLLLLLLVSATTSLAQSSKTSSTPNNFFPIEQIRAGMKAVGYTVTSGSEPEKFDVEILGVMNGFPNPNQSAVIIRVLGEQYAHSGIFGGMSGSPVYIDGKLIGAVAFSYQFSKDAIGGVTPIQQMVDIFEQQKQGSSSSESRPRSISFSEISFNENSREYTDFLKSVSGVSATGAQAAASPVTQVLQRIATPLSVTGIAPEVLNRFAPIFQSWGFMPVAGTAGAAKIETLTKANANTLKPGSTIVVPLVRGDFSLATSGTVTHRDGERIYAFGHPFLSLGVSDMPMNEGQVITVIPNTANSFKIAVPTAMVGVVSGDRSTGIYGELGRAPKMIPVEINLSTSRGVTQPYRFEMVADRFLTPILMQMTTMATIQSTERTVGDSTLQLRTRISLKGQPEIVLENRLSTSINAPLVAAFATAAPINALFNSGFKDLLFERIQMDIVSRDSRNTGKLERLWINRTEVKRGEKIEVVAFARTDSGNEYIERIPIQIPEDAPLGQMQILIGDGSALQSSEPRSGFTPKSLSQMVSELNRLRKSDRLYYRLSRAETGAIINNEELPNLPPSVLATLGSDRTSGGYSLTRSTTLLEKELPPAEFVISGQRTLNVTVVEQ